MQTLGHSKYLYLNIPSIPSTSLVEILKSLNLHGAPAVIYQSLEGAN